VAPHPLAVSRPELLLLIVAMALVTLAERASFLLLHDRLAIPPFLRRALAYVPAAVLAAIVTPALFQPSGVALGPIDVRLLAGALAGAVAWRTRSVIATFGAGMVALWILSALVTRT
jgi:branched-subunit amino acid transport protein